jgi:NAD-reducing hydrogenase small subunit
MARPRLATVWLDGCSGCHMSFLDLDEALIELLEVADLVYSPLVDTKEFPEAVDVTLVEGAVSSEDDLRKIRLVRDRTSLLVALGDCAVTTNVPGMRNPIGTAAVLERAYVENVTDEPGAPRGAPRRDVPALLSEVLAVHEVVDVDVFVPGCPPSAQLIGEVLTSLLAGDPPEPVERAGGRRSFG